MEFHWRLRGRGRISGFSVAMGLDSDVPFDDGLRIGGRVSTYRPAEKRDSVNSFVMERYRALNLFC